MSCRYVLLGALGAVMSALGASGTLEYTFQELSSTQTKAYLDGLCTQSARLIPMVVCVHNTGSVPVNMYASQVCTYLGEDVVADRLQVGRALRTSLFWRGCVMYGLGVSIPLLCGSLALVSSLGCGSPCMPAFWITALVAPLPISFGSFYWGSSIGAHNEKVEHLLRHRMLKDSTIYPGQTYEGVVFIRSGKIKKARTHAAMQGTFVSAIV